MLSFLLVEALVIVGLLVWVIVLLLRAAGRLGPRRGLWAHPTRERQPYRVKP